MNKDDLQLWSSLCECVVSKLVQQYSEKQFHLFIHCSNIYIIYIYIINNFKLIIVCYIHLDPIHGSMQLPV